MKKTFVTMEQLQKIAQTYPTPYHLYDEQGIRANARRLKAAFAWNPGFKEFFAVKATPTPAILKILHEEGCGTDCSSMTELMLSERCGITGRNIMFSSNATPPEEFLKALELGALINLDDYTHIDFLSKLGPIPETICCRFNPGGVFAVANHIMDNPNDAKIRHERENKCFRHLKNSKPLALKISVFMLSWRAIRFLTRTIRSLPHSFSNWPST